MPVHRVLAYVFAVAVVNFLLGFALAAWRERGFAPPSPRRPRWRRAARQAETPPVAPTEEHVAVAPPASSDDVAREAPASKFSLAEAFRPTLALDITSYRQRLLEFQDRAAQCADAGTMNALIVEFEEMNRQWLAGAAAAREQLAASLTWPDEGAATAERLGALLDSLTRRCEAISEFLATATDDESLGTVCGRMAEESQGLLHELQTLRDERFLAQLALAETDGGVERIPQEQLADPQTGLHNRLGLEAVYRQWRRENAGKAWSIAVLDIDGFSRLNERLGTAVGDRLLAAFGGLADDLLRKDRGFDRAAHHRADSFVLFLGDTDADNAVNAAERIRQTIEASSFSLPNEDVELTIGVGLATAGHNDALTDLLDRAQEAAALAKAEGGNRTVTATAAGLHSEPPRPFQVKGRVVKLTARSEVGSLSA